MKRIFIVVILLLATITNLSAASAEQQETRTWHPAENYFYSDKYGTTECTKNFAINSIDIFSTTQYMTTTTEAGYYNNNDPAKKVYTTDTGSESYSWYSYENEAGVYDSWTYQYKHSY